MKMANYLLLTATLLSAINCSSAIKTTAENVNANVQNSSESQSAAKSAAATENQTQTATPDALLKDLYKTHANEKIQIINSSNRTLIDKYFDRNLGDLIWKDLTRNVDEEVGVIDFDLFYNAQDADIKKVVVGAPKINGEKATVPVTFENYGQKNTLVYTLVKEKSAWKISDINYGKDNDSLLKYFESANESINTDENASGEFEGKYQIGDTTCTVKPVKMAFEIRWEKGAGVEMFFADERRGNRITFSSDPKNRRSNVFSFDDETYNTGIFFRADGKEFPIKRIKRAN